MIDIALNGGVFTIYQYHRNRVSLYVRIKNTAEDIIFYDFVLESWREGIVYVSGVKTVNIYIGC